MAETRDYVARLNNTPDGGFGADVGYIAGRLCRTARVQVTDLAGTVVDDFDVDYYVDEHDDDDLPDEAGWPNFTVPGPGYDLAMSVLRGRGWEPSGPAFGHSIEMSTTPEPWHGGGVDHEYVHVRKVDPTA